MEDYYGTDDISDSICAMMNMPENENVRKYIQNYNLNMIRLKDFTKEQVDRFRSDFACIVKFFAESYNKEEPLQRLKTDKQALIHTKDKRYLKLSEISKEESKVCEAAEALEKEGKEKINELNRRLLADGRTEDILKSINNSQYQEALLEE